VLVREHGQRSERDVEHLGDPVDDLARLRAWREQVVEQPLRVNEIRNDNPGAASSRADVVEPAPRSAVVARAKPAATSM